MNDETATSASEELAVTRRELSPTTRYLIGFVVVLCAAGFGYAVQDQIDDHDVSEVAHAATEAKEAEQVRGQVGGHNDNKYAHPEVQEMFRQELRDIQTIQLQEIKTILKEFHDDGG